eukprot:scaffold3837_cov621-Pavlova_lutheri.AAC.2
MPKYDLHVRDPENGPHPRAEDVFVEPAIGDHRVRLSREVETKLGPLRIWQCRTSLVVKMPVMLLCRRWKAWTFPSFLSLVSRGR